MVRSVIALGGIGKGNDLFGSGSFFVLFVDGIYFISLLCLFHPQPHSALPTYSFRADAPVATSFTFNYPSGSTVPLIWAPPTGMKYH